ncbi:hypothetical protein ACFXKD_27845 [Nocardiopsis aegyptia]|uniref:phage tail protein n=1 Tax=Nocardiopsis aegyptia TaxID=220378 RepID=UPI003670C600
MPSLAKFRSQLTGALETLERKMVVNVPTKIDLEGARRSAEAARRVIERELADVQTVVNVTPDGVDIRTTNRQLDALAKERAAQITVDLDRSSLSRATQALSRLGEGLGGLGKSGVGLAAAAGALSTLAAGAAAAVVPILQLGTALAPMAGILATVPALAAGAAAAGGALAIAFVGVGDAMGAALTGDMEALGEALEGLAPSAAAVVREVSVLQPQLDALRESVQEGFFAPLVGQVTELGERMLPSLTAGLTDVGSALGESAATLAEFAGTPLNIQFLEALFKSTGQAIRNADGALPSFLAGLREIGEVGLPYLEDAGSALETLAQRFDTWASQVSASGEATQWIEDALDTFSQLGDIATNVGGIISSVFGAAGDGGILDTIETLTGALNEFFASAEGQDALAGVFEGLASIGSALSPVITALASGIGELAPVVGRIAEAFGPLLTTAIEGLVPALIALEPGITAIIDGLGQGIDALVESGALEMLGTALSEIMVALAPLLPVIGELAALLVGVLAEALIALAPGLTELVMALVEGLGPILPELAASFTELIEALAPLIPPLIEALLPVFEILPELLQMIAAQTSQWATMIAELQPVLEFVIEILGWLIGILADIIIWVLDVVTAFWKFGDQAEEVGTRIGEAIGAMVRRVVDFFTNLRDRGAELIGGLRDRVVGAVTSLRDRALDRARKLRDGLVDFVTGARDRAVELAQGLADGVTDRIDSAVDTVRDLPKRVRDFFSGARDWLTNAGKNVVYGLIEGINDAVSGLWDRMGDIAQGVRDYWPFSPAKRGPLRSHPMDRAGRNIAEMLAAGISSGERIVANASEGLAGAVARPPAAAASKLRRPDDDKVTAGRPVVQVTNHYPQAEPTSTSTNRTLQYAAAIGVV